MTQFKDKSAKQRKLVSAGLFLYPVLQAADVLAYRAEEVPVGEDQRQHVELMREIARRFNERFGELLVEPGHRIPEIGARIMDLQDPGAKMTTTGGSEQGAVYVLDEPETVRKKVISAVTDSGREVAAARSKEGIANLIEILAVIRGVDPDRVEAEFADAGYGDFKKAIAEAVVEYLAPSASATRLCDRTRPRSRRPRGGAEKARAIASATLAEVRDAMGVGRGESGPRPLFVEPRAGRGSDPPRDEHADLDLDLDVFAGPFDLLMTVVLREEIDLLEVDLAEIVVAYLEHLEARGELDLEAATEFLVLIAALLELKSRLMLPGEEVEELDDRARRGRRGAGRADARVPPLPRRRRAPRRAARRRPPFTVPLAPLPPELRRVALDARRRLRARRARRRSATCCATPPRST